NPSRIRERLAIPASFQRLWRNPEVLVWPTILSGFGALALSGLWADVSWNILKVFLALYGIQGLAILSGIFDLWKLRGFARALGFFLVFTLMLPMLLALGFFDLWFDFRTKLRQS
ncbi:MAG: YybS family protein, partial [Bdellovibrionales bacterium]|nr:YybS family protein [Bdellovibrionales bacterium]